MTDAPPPCPRCELADRVGEIEVQRHVGGGEWKTFRMWVCGWCQGIVGPKIAAAGATATQSH